jgi:hypothetical protein
MFSWFSGLLVPWDGAGSVGGQQVFDLANQAIEIDGLGVKIISPRITGGFFVFSSGVSGQCDDGNGGGLCLNWQKSFCIQHR